MKRRWTAILVPVALTATSTLFAQNNSTVPGSTVSPPTATGGATVDSTPSPVVPAPTATVAEPPEAVPPTVTTDKPAQAKAPPAQSPTSMRHLEAPAPDPVEDRGPPTLLGGRTPSLGGYGGLSVVGSSMKGQGVVYVGAEGALLVDHRLALGLAGYGLATRIEGPNDSNGDPQRLGFGYGGFVLRYSCVQRRPYYLTVGALVGAGGVAYHPDYDNHHFDRDDDVHPDTLFVVEPSVGGHLNLTRWARLGVSVGYRMVTGVDRLTQIEEKDLSGFAYGGNLQLGWF